MKSALIAASVLFLLTWTAVAKDINTSKFTRLICTVYDEDLIHNPSCKVKPISRDKSVANLSGFLTRQVDQIQPHITLYKKYNTAYKPFLINVHENFCEIFTKKYGAPYTRIVASTIANYSNLNHACPYEGEIFIRDVPMDTSKLKALWPEGDYRLDIDIRGNNQINPILTIQVYIEVQEKLFG